MAAWQTRDDSLALTTRPGRPTKSSTRSVWTPGFWPRWNAAYHPPSNLPHEAVPRHGAPGRVVYDPAGRHCGTPLLQRIVLLDCHNDGSLGLRNPAVPCSGATISPNDTLLFLGQTNYSEQSHTSHKREPHNSHQPPTPLPLDRNTQALDFRLPPPLNP
jgi:hypothetical protein